MQVSTCHEPAISIAVLWFCISISVVFRARSATIILFSDYISVYFSWIIMNSILFLSRILGGILDFLNFALTRISDRVANLIVLFFGFMIGLIYFDNFNFSLFLKNQFFSSIWNAWNLLFWFADSFFRGSRSIISFGYMFSRWLFNCLFLNSLFEPLILSLHSLFLFCSF